MGSGARGLGRECLILGSEAAPRASGGLSSSVPSGASQGPDAPGQLITYEHLGHTNAVLCLYPVPVCLTAGLDRGAVYE